MDRNGKGIYRYVAWGLTAFAVIAASVGLVFLFIHIEKVAAAFRTVLAILKPVILGVVLAYLTSPVYNRILRFAEAYGEKHHGKSGTVKKAGKLFGTLGAFFLLCAIAVGLFSMMIPELYASIQNVLSSLPANSENLRAWINETLFVNFEYHDQIMAYYDNAFAMMQNFLVNDLPAKIPYIIEQAYSSVMSAARWIYDIVIGLIVMIYLLNFKDTLLPQCKKLIYTVLPTSWAEHTISELRYIHTVFGGFIIGKILDSLIIGVLTFAILWIFRMPYTLLVAVIVGVTNVIPFFGPFIGAVPSTVLIALANPVKALIFIGLILLIQQFDGNYLGPKILGDKTGISSFWVLFSILLFGGLFGFVGMLIAVPTWAVLMDLVGKISAIVLKKKNLPTDAAAYK